MPTWSPGDAHFQFRAPVTSQRDSIILPGPGAQSGRLLTTEWHPLGLKNHQAGPFGSQSPKCWSFTAGFVPTGMMLPANVSNLWFPGLRQRCVSGSGTSQTVSTRTAPGIEYGPECRCWLECTYVRLLMFSVGGSRCELVYACLWGPRGGHTGCVRVWLQWGMQVGVRIWGCT